MRKVNGQRTPSDGKSSHCLWQSELKNIKLLVRYYNKFSCQPTFRKPWTSNTGFIDVKIMKEFAWIITIFFSKYGFRASSRKILRQRMYNIYVIRG